LSPRGIGRLVKSSESRVGREGAKIFPNRQHSHVRHHLTVTNILFLYDSNDSRRLTMTHGSDVPQSVFRILDLPLELFQRILVESFLVRGIARGIRLRLVNRPYISIGSFRESANKLKASFQTKFMTSFSYTTCSTKSCHWNRRSVRPSQRRISRTAS
jgi:hypothetical protein